MTKLLQIRTQLCALSGFCHEVDENCAPLGYYAASSGNFLPSLFGFLTPKDGTNRLSQMSVRNYHYSQHNNPKEHCSLSYIHVRFVAIKEMTVYVTDLRQPMNKD